MAIAVLLAIMLAGCGSVSKRETVSMAPPARGGGYYLDDGPGASPPANLDAIPDAVPRAEPIRAANSRPYVVMGSRYTPMTSLQPYRARGIATWYGRRYHGRQTASGEIYDMYAMTAAHPILPIPSYARVTHLGNGRSVVVRINDRGPFLDGRLIDLSYTAAHRLGMLGAGSAMVEVETLIPGHAVTAAPPPPDPRPAAPAVTAVAGTPPPPAVPQIPVASDGENYFLQLGAFGSLENAETFLARLQAQLDWLASAHVFPRDGLFRVHAGPYATQAEARASAERISESLGVKPFVLTR